MVRPRIMGASITETKFVALLRKNLQLNSLMAVTGVLYR